MPVTSAKAPIDKPSKPICEAKPNAASTMVALVCRPLSKVRPLPSSVLRPALAAGFREALADVMCLTVIFKNRTLVLFLHENQI
jgi:hypothetical protein